MDYPTQPPLTLPARPDPISHSVVNMVSIFDLFPDIIVNAYPIRAIHT